jgi:hypothetical protein
MHHYVDPLTMIFRLADEWFNRRLADGGPVYAEYHPENIIVEPWNAASSLFMIIPAVYWFLRLRKSGKIHAFVLFALLMVFLGGLGSTLFHAFRMSKVFLMLDVIPSAVLTLAIGIWFWLKILPKWWYVLLIFVPVFLIRFVLFGQLPQHVGINVSYAISGLLVIVPLLVYLYRSHFQKLSAVIAVLVSFSFALLFRQLDPFGIPFLPQGTHFLWHLFSALGAYFMIEYLIFTSQKETKSSVNKG